MAAQITFGEPVETPDEIKFGAPVKPAVQADDISFGEKVGAPGISFGEKVGTNFDVTLPPKPFEAAEVTRSEVIDAERNLELLLDNYVYSVETENNRMTAVWAMSSRGTQRRLLAGRFF